MAKISDTKRDKSRSAIAKGKTLSRRMERRLKAARAFFPAEQFPSLHAL